MINNILIQPVLIISSLDDAVLSNLMSQSRLTALVVPPTLSRYPITDYVELLSYVCVDAVAKLPGEKLTARNQRNKVLFKTQKLFCFRNPHRP